MRISIITVAVVAAVAALTMLALPTQAEVILPNLPVGSQYQLIFVTSGDHDALSPEIDDYNTFVMQEAALGTSLPTATWRAVASTPFVQAISNAITYPSIPIYNTHGELLASGTVDLWDGSLTHAVTYNQWGLATEFPVVWTGTAVDGTDEHNHQLGLHPSLSSRVGSANTLGSTWISSGNDDPVLPHALYALSSPITVTPEPATVSLLATALLGLGGTHFLRQRRRAKG
jgi:hypothetical protein